MAAAPLPPSRSSPKTPAALPAAVESCLNAALAQLDTLDADLVAGDATVYEAHCAALQTTMLALRDALASSVVKGPLVSERLRQLGVRLGQQRDNMARRAVPVEKQVQFMLPGLAGATYSRTAGAYGAGQRAVGKFTSVRA